MVHVAATAETTTDKHTVQHDVLDRNPEGPGNGVDQVRGGLRSGPDLYTLTIPVDLRDGVQRLHLRLVQKVGSVFALVGASWGRDLPRWLITGDLHVRLEFCIGIEVFAIYRAPIDFELGGGNDGRLVGLTDYPDSVRQRDHVEHTWGGSGGLINDPEQCRTGHWRAHHHPVHHPGQLHIDAVLRFPAYLRGDIAAGQVVADQPEVSRILEVGVVDVGHGRGDRSKGRHLPVADPTATAGVYHDAGLGRELVGSHSPSGRNIVEQHATGLRALPP